MKGTNNENLLRISDIINDNMEETVQGESPEATRTFLKQTYQKREGEKQHIPRGRPKSGRIWKEQKTKFSSIIKTRGLQSSLAKKQKLREDLKRVKEISRTIKAEKQAEKEAKKQRRIENLRRTEENRKRSEIVQVITNTAKLKRMKKKQLRMIEKRDTNKK